MAIIVWVELMQPPLPLQLLLPPIKSRVVVEEEEEMIRAEGVEKREVAGVETGTAVATLEVEDVVVATSPLWALVTAHLVVAAIKQMMGMEIVVVIPAADKQRQWAATELMAMAMAR